MVSLKPKEGLSTIHQLRHSFMNDQKPSVCTYPNNLSIPTESDWGDYHSDLDQKWAHDHYLGRSNEEMRGYFDNAPIEGTSDLQFMPEIPFRYYIFGYRDFVMLSDFQNGYGSDPASCFMNLVKEKLEEQPQYIIPIMPHLLGTLEYIAQHQAEFEAEEYIYGSFPKLLEEIKDLYAKNARPD